MSQGITYELAKQLKDAGFPQHGRDVMTPHTSDIAAGRESVYYPDLSELIEACGKDVGLALKGHIGKKWSAYGLFPSFTSQIEKRGGGSTPEEAVAKLWLALNPITHL